jgi:hypothetical protein
MFNTPLHITPGDNLVARVDDVVVYAEGPAEDLQHLATELARLLPATDWTGLVRFLASTISAVGFDTHPPIACLQLLEAQVNVFVFGDLSIVVETSSSLEAITGSGLTTWREASVPGAVQSVSGGLPEQNDSLTGTLERGIVRGGGFTLGNSTTVSTPTSMLGAISGAATVSASAAPAASMSTATAAEANSPVETEEPADADDPSEQRGAEVDDDPRDPAGETVRLEPDATIDSTEFDAPTISIPPPPPPAAAFHPAFDNPDTSGHAASGHAASGHAASGHPAFGDAEDTGSHAEITRDLRGVRCPSGHLVSMQDTTCRTCSAPVDLNGPIVSGPRPVLGMLEFDDGVRIPLDRPVVIGRQPPEDYRINGELAYVVPVTDAEGLISRVHVELHLIGWDIELIDKNSVNGTFTSTSADSTSRARLRPEHRTQIDIGTIVYVGDRIFRLNTGVVEQNT